jgi:hypothetical protein
MGQSSGIGRHGNSRDLRRVLRRQVIEAGNGVNRGEARARMQESKHICTEQCRRHRQDERTESEAVVAVMAAALCSSLVCFGRRSCAAYVMAIASRLGLRQERGKTTHSRYVVQNAACREICPSNRPVLGRGMSFSPLFLSWTCVVLRSDTRSSGNRVRAMHRRRLHGRA